MKRLLISVTVVLLLISCKKESGSGCYECDFSPINRPGSSPGTYQDAGCMTADQWNTVKFTDDSGNLTLDKGRYCRKK